MPHRRKRVYVWSSTPRNWKASSIRATNKKLETYDTETSFYKGIYRASIHHL